MIIKKFDGENVISSKATYTIILYIEKGKIKSVYYVNSINLSPSLGYNIWYFTYGVH